MRTYLLGLLVCAQFLPHGISFLTAPLSTVLGYTRRNLTCSLKVDTLYNGITTSGYNMDFTGGDYCLVAVSTSMVNNLPQITTYRTAIFLWNKYRNIAIHQCKFSTTMDIGYGNCIPYYYENATSIQLCICSTDRCGDTYSSCQASVNQAKSSPPPLLPVLQPTLSNAIRCYNRNASESQQSGVDQNTYLIRDYPISFGTADYSKCLLYALNHTVICAGFYLLKQRDYSAMGMIEGTYETSMLRAAYYGALSSNRTSGYYQYQTPTSVASIMRSSDIEYDILECLCTTNNCNVNLTTCTSGMNIPWSLLTYSNGSTSTSTTGMTSSTSVSSSIITALQSSTSTSVATSVSSVGNNNTPSASTASGSPSEKVFSCNPQ
jgi:hypothetical protein